MCLPKARPCPACQRLCWLTPRCPPYTAWLMDGDSLKTLFPGSLCPSAQNGAAGMVPRAEQAAVVPHGPWLQQQKAEERTIVIQCGGSAMPVLDIGNVSLGQSWAFPVILSHISSSARECNDAYPGRHNKHPCYTHRWDSAQSPSGQR